MSLTALAWEPVRNANSLAPPQIHRIRNATMGLCSLSFHDDRCSDLRTTPEALAKSRLAHQGTSPQDLARPSSWPPCSCLSPVSAHLDSVPYSGVSPSRKLCPRTPYVNVPEPSSPRGFSFALLRHMAAISAHPCRRPSCVCGQGSFQSCPQA